MKKMKISESIVPDVGSDAWLQQTCRAAYFDADNHESWAKKLDQVASQVSISHGLYVFRN